VGQVVCPLGVGAHFEAWGYGKETVFEGDWYSVLEGKGGFAIHILPARHFFGPLTDPEQDPLGGLCPCYP